MQKLKVIHFDLDGVLWVPGDFLEEALKLCVRKGMENGLDVQSIDEGIELTKTIRKATGSNAQNHFDILIGLCNKKNEDLVERIKNEEENPVKLINENFNKDYSLRKTGINQDYMLLQTMVHEYKNAKMSNMKPALNAVDTLDELLKQNYILTLVSNGIWDKQLDKLDELNLGHYFRHRQVEPEIKIIDSFVEVSGDENHKEKPNPYMWLKQREKVRQYYGNNFLQREVHVGDKYVADIMGANGLGIFTVKVNQGEHSSETIEEALESRKIPKVYEKNARELLRPDITIDSISKLPAALYEIEMNYKEHMERKEYQKDIVKNSIINSEKII